MKVFSITCFFTPRKRKKWLRHSCLFSFILKRFSYEMLPNAVCKREILNTATIIITHNGPNENCWTSLRSNITRHMAIKNMRSCWDVAELCCISITLATNANRQGWDVHFLSRPSLTWAPFTAVTLPSHTHTHSLHRHHCHLVNKGQAIRHLEGQLICHPSANVSASDLVRRAWYCNKP